jgi:hypothetical protein
LDRKGTDAFLVVPGLESRDLARRACELPGEMDWGGKLRDELLDGRWLLTFKNPV